MEGCLRITVYTTAVEAGRRRDGLHGVAGILLLQVYRHCSKLSDKLLALQPRQF